MLLNLAVAQGIRDGAITAVFRRWDAPRVKPGGTQRTPAGVVRFMSVAPVEMDDLTEAAAPARGPGKSSP